MNVHEFRSNLKKHLDDAVKGKIITIERGGVTFTLMAGPTGVSVTHANIEPSWQITNGKLAEEKPDVLSVPPSETVTVKAPPKLNTTKPLNKDGKDYSLCKHGNVRGFCKQGCK